MLVQDVTAFIEELEVIAKGDGRTEKHRRRVAQAKIDVLETQRDVRMAAEALGQMEHALARGVESVGTGRGFLRRHAGSLEREIETVRAHLAAKRSELTAKQQRLNRVEQSARECDDAHPSTTTFRFHSVRGHLDCSAARFERLSASQLELPVFVARKDGQRWWWYRDRFWWGDEGLTASEVEKLVLESDLLRKQRSVAVVLARATLLGETRVPAVVDGLSDATRLAVWRRDRGRCVDCGSGENVEFDYIVPTSQGGSDAEVNVELRCRSCCIRLARNETRSRVSRARVDALPLYRNERVSA